MGLEKGATSVSKEAGGGKATQINYGSKPTTRFKHPKAKSDKKYIHSPAKGTVKVEKEGEKTREIGVSEESKLKNASVSSADLAKSHAKVPSKFFDKPEAERKRIVGEKAWKNYDEKNEMIRATSAHEKKDVYGKPTGESKKSLDERTADLYKSLDAILEKKRD
jgi:hypothetical protein